jgi:hypothetical protein
MDYVALKLSEKTLDQKVDLTTNLAAAFITNIATYATPDPTPTVMTGKVTAINAKKTLLSAALAVADGHLTDLAALEADLDATLTSSAAYIQKTSGGVAAKIALLNVPIKGKVSPMAAPGQVLNLKLARGDNAGEIKSSCKPDPNAKSYEYWMTLDPTKPDTWKMCDTSSGCRATLTGYTSGSIVWIRVRAVGGKKTGKGPWSDPATITVP